MDLFARFRRPHTPPSAREPLLDERQRHYWQRASLLDRVADPAFPYSPRFDIPAPILQDIRLLLALGGGVDLAAGQPSASPYQEKLSLPFVEAARQRLAAAGQDAPLPSLAGRVALATAPLSSVYPRVDHDSIADEFVVLFDMAMLLYYVTVLNAVWAIGEPLQAPGAPPITLEHLFARSQPGFIARAEPEVHALAELLFNLVVNDWPVPTKSSNTARLYRTAVPAEMVADFYTFSLAHELAHLALGHFNDDAPRVAPMEREIDADTEALARTLKSHPRPADTFPAYVAVVALFEVMGLIYRTVNYLAFRRDYRNMPEAAMHRLYFADPELVRYPHPRTRMFALTAKAAARHSQFSERIARIEYQARAFFDNVWVAVEPRMAPMEHAPSPLWRPVVGLHRLAHG